MEGQIMIRLALFQPDIAQNTGTILRMAACLDIGVDIIEPAGFPVSDRSFRRSGMDYLDHVEVRRHDDFEAFDTWRRAAGHRLVLLTTQGDADVYRFDFVPGDILMAGRESAGVPDHVHNRADQRVVIPIRQGLRSLNVAVAMAMASVLALDRLRRAPPSAPP